MQGGTAIVRTQPLSGLQGRRMLGTAASADKPSWLTSEINGRDLNMSLSQNAIGRSNVPPLM